MKYTREHANGWIAEVEASDVQGQWHVVAYHPDIGLDQIPAALYVLGEVEAKQLGDTFVHEHGGHECSAACMEWRLVDETTRGT